MFDFLCVLPHGSASHSLVHYLNQHRSLHVAQDYVNRPDDAFQEEALLRPWVKAVGVAIKNYHVSESTQNVLRTVKRDLIIQTTRDPIESFVSHINNTLFMREFKARMGYPASEQIAHPVPEMEAHIADALAHFICPHAAEVICEVDGFEEHIVVDVSELRGDGSERTARRLWKRICGDDDDQDLLSKSFVPLGSRPYFHLYNFRVNAEAEGQTLRVRMVPEGELRIDSLNSGTKGFQGFEKVVHVFPDINVILPSLGLTGPLSICVVASEWDSFHPKARPAVLRGLIPLVEQALRAFEYSFARAEKETTFTVDKLNSTQRSLLAKGLVADFAAFRRRHPEVAERWTATRAFLGV